MRIAATIMIALTATASTASAKGPRKSVVLATKTPAAIKRPPPASRANEIEVTVADVAGSHLYVKPGSRGGVHRGSKLAIAGREYTVTQTTSSYAIAHVDAAPPPKEGDKGRATVVDEPERDGADATLLKKPRPASAFDDVWPEAEAPASAQTPRFVPLGDGEREASARAPRFDVRITSSGSVLLPMGQRGGMIGSGELNLKVHAERFTASPIAISMDASIQKWSGPGMDDRDGRAARPLLRARELMLAYGAMNGDGFAAGVGRMRYAAATLGTLDGLRLRTSLGGGFAVAGFGGALPDPLSAAPSSAAQRFGVEASYSSPQGSDTASSLRTEAAVVLHGSTFNGQLDERRLSGAIGIYPGAARFGSHFEVASFAAENPFGASSLELTNAGLDGSVRIGSALQIGARFDMRRPERSLWLASYLPLSFLCLTQPTAQPNGQQQEPCDGRTPTRAEGSADATVTLDRVSIGGGASFARDIGINGLPSMVSTFGNARVVRILKHFRADVMVGYSSASYLQMVSATSGPGMALFDGDLDLGAYYRYARISYAVGGESRVEHGIGTGVTLLPSRSFSLALQGEAMTGSDARVLVAFLTATWRPNL